jgi:MFS family permease
LEYFLSFSNTISHPKEQQEPPIMEPVASNKLKPVAVTGSGVDVIAGEAVPWDPQAEKALVRKIDLRIFPVMIILFILNFIDRNNFANARLNGLEADLGLTDVQYQTCISILLVGYVSMQVPSNLILNAITRPSWYLCGCVATWGVISACTGAVHNAVGAIMCRFFLGCVEASFFPGSLYLLSRWYTRKEMQLRVTILNAGNLAAQAFGGLIAAGILGDMQGASGLSAWRWLFIIEGAITVFIAFLASFVLPDYPGTTRWLTPEEKIITLRRLELDAGDDPAKLEGLSGLQGLRLAATDPKVWLLGATYFATIMGLSVRSNSPSCSYSFVVDVSLTAPCSSRSSSRPSHSPWATERRLRSC